MACYFFHLCDGGDQLIDPDGREIVDPSRIPGLAMKEARSCISHDALDGRIEMGQWIEVRDEDDRLIYFLRFRDAVAISSDCLILSQ